MRITSKVLITLLIVVAITACFSLITHLSNESQPVGDEIPARILISQTPLSTPLFVAKKLGLFKLHGIDITLIPCNGGVECMSMMTHGKAQYATISESVAMFNSFRDTDFSIISTFVTSDDDLKLLALPRRGFTSIRDLKGKSIGVIKSSASEFYLDSLLLASGMKPTDIERVYLKPDKLIQMMKIGKVDAISSWEPWGYRAQATMDVVNLGFQGMYTLSFNLATMNRKDETSHERSKRILAALQQAITWIQDHPEKAKAIVSDTLNIENNQLDWMWRDYVFRLSMTNVLLANLQLQARWALEHNLVEGKQPDLRSILDRSALQAMQDEVVGQ
ncbi:ABC transporter substrate-binding protein [Vibrio palustris]|uniref:Putative aliphatic sulfonates-binding protein n=1 Tax=Vibrio palustris TaxID=1918946 RepID=A0A1R4B2C2_9VIBR|nr:ABC transporter substrate-binding protein [Vibrio palustris]SJL83058.1 Putative aliphatic sulfonates-binding protein precursor [Vibrio palustris]